MLLSYGLTNAGAFSILATTYSEKYGGYWLSILLAGSVCFLLPVLLAIMYNRTYKASSARSSEMSQAFKIIVIVQDERAAIRMTPAPCALML